MASGEPDAGRRLDNAPTMDPSDTADQMTANLPELGGRLTRQLIQLIDVLSNIDAEEAPALAKAAAEGVERLKRHWRKLISSYNKQVNQNNQTHAIIHRVANQQLPDLIATQNGLSVVVTQLADQAAAAQEGDIASIRSLTEKVESMTGFGEELAKEMRPFVDEVNACQRETGSKLETVLTSVKKIADDRLTLVLQDGTTVKDIANDVTKILEELIGYKQVASQSLELQQTLKSFLDNSIDIGRFQASLEKLEVQITTACDKNTEKAVAPLLGEMQKISMNYNDITRRLDGLSSEAKELSSSIGANNSAVSSRLESLDGVLNTTREDVQRILPELLKVVTELGHLSSKELPKQLTAVEDAVKPMITAVTKMSSELPAALSVAVGSNFTKAILVSIQKNVLELVDSSERTIEAVKTVSAPIQTIADMTPLLEGLRLSLNGLREVAESAATKSDIAGHAEAISNISKKLDEMQDIAEKERKKDNGRLQSQLSAMNSTVKALETALITKLQDVSTAQQVEQSRHESQIMIDKIMEYVREASIQYNKLVDAWEKMFLDEDWMTDLIYKGQQKIMPELTRTRDRIDTSLTTLDSRLQERDKALTDQLLARVNSTLDNKLGERFNSQNQSIIEVLDQHFKRVETKAESTERRFEDIVRREIDVKVQSLTTILLQALASAGSQPQNLPEAVSTLVKRLMDTRSTTATAIRELSNNIDALKQALTEKLADMQQLLVLKSDRQYASLYTTMNMTMNDIGGKLRSLSELDIAIADILSKVEKIEEGTLPSQDDEGMLDNSTFHSNLLHLIDVVEANAVEGQRLAEQNEKLRAYEEYFTTYDLIGADNMLRPARPADESEKSESSSDASQQEYPALLRNLLLNVTSRLQSFSTTKESTPKRRTGEMVSGDAKQPRIDITSPYFTRTQRQDPLRNPTPDNIFINSPSPRPDTPRAFASSPGTINILRPTPVRASEATSLLQRVSTKGSGNGSGHRPSTRGSMTEGGRPASQRGLSGRVGIMAGGPLPDFFQSLRGSRYRDDSDDEILFPAPVEPSAPGSADSIDDSAAFETLAQKSSSTAPAGEMPTSTQEATSTASAVASSTTAQATSFAAPADASSTTEIGASFNNTADAPSDAAPGSSYTTPPGPSAATVPSATASLAPGPSSSATPGAFSTDPAAASSADPEGAPSADTEGEPSANPASASSTKPAGAPSTDPAAASSANPEGAPSADPEGAPSADPASASFPAPPAASSTDPAGEPSTDPVAASSGDPASAPSADPAGESSTAPPAASSTDLTGESSAVPPPREVQVGTPEELAASGIDESTKNAIRSGQRAWRTKRPPYDTNPLCRLLRHQANGKPIKGCIARITTGGQPDYTLDQAKNGVPCRWSAERPHVCVVPLSVDRMLIVNPRS